MAVTPSNCLVPFGGRPVPTLLTGLVRRTSVDRTVVLASGTVILLPTTSVPPGFGIVIHGLILGPSAIQSARLESVGAVRRYTEFLGTGPTGTTSLVLPISEYPWAVGFRSTAPLADRGLQIAYSGSATANTMIIYSFMPDEFIQLDLV